MMAKLNGRRAGARRVRALCLALAVASSAAGAQSAPAPAPTQADAKALVEENFRRTFAVAPDIRAPTKEEQASLDAAKNLMWTRASDRGPEQTQANLRTLRAAIALSERTYGPAHQYTAVLLSMLADALFEVGTNAEAELVFRRALGIYEARLGTGHDLTRQLYYSLAHQLVAQHRFAEAEVMQRRVVTEAERALGPDAFDLAIYLGELASILRETSRFQEAIPLLERAAKLTAAKVGPDHMMSIDAVQKWALAVEESGQIAQAEALLRRNLAERQAALGGDDVQVARAAAALGNFLRRQRHESEAEALFQRVLAIRVEKLGENHALTSQLLDSLGDLYSDQARYAQAEATYRRMLAADESRLGGEDPEIAVDLRILATAVESQDRYAEAETMRRRALALYEKTSGEDSADTVVALGELSSNLSSQSRHADAEAAARRMLAIASRVFGQAHEDTGMAHDRLAIALELGGKNPEAEAEYKSAIEVLDKVQGEGGVQSLSVRADYADFLYGVDRYTDAEALYRKVVAGREALLGADHPDTGAAVAELAGMLVAQGRYAEAEPLYRRDVAIRESRLGADHVDTSIAVAGLAFVLSELGREQEAQELNRRALAVQEAKLGPNHYETLQTVSNLAGTFMGADGDVAEAERLYRRAVQGTEQQAGANSTMTALYLNNLGAALARLGRLDEAEAMHRRALAIREAKEPGSVDVSGSLKNLARVLDQRGQWAEADSARLRALAIREQRLGPQHPDVAMLLGERAQALAAQGRAREAEPSARRAVAIARAHRDRESAAADSFVAARAFDDPVDPAQKLYAGYLPIAWQADPASASMRDEAFRAAQDLDVSGAARALAQAAARVGAGECAAGTVEDDCLASLARRQQDLALGLRSRDRELLAATAKGDGVAAAKLRAEVEAGTKALAEVDARLRKRFPDYASLVSPRALAIAQAQSRLQPDEGLLMLIPAGKDVFAFGVGPDAARWHRLEGGAEKVAGRIARLRCQADPANCGGDAEGTRGVASVYGQAKSQGQKAFDRDVAHALYADLVAPVEPAFANAKRLYVVAAGPLSALPLGVLVTQPPLAGEDDADPQVLARTAWLADRYALTTLPAVSSLRAIAREHAAKSGATSFLGFGDPVLLGGAGATRGAVAPRIFRSVDTAGVALADPSTLRTQMAPLPGTRVELAAMAQAMNAPAEALHLGEAATEAAVKSSTVLPKSRVVAFATHGLLPKEVRGLDEPGLVFTPPQTATPVDDGVLAASEAATLDLDADWLILSACNTAAADGSAGGDSLSGLARAFLYAGARALLVSHWRVRDDVTAVLTVETLKNRSGGSRAQALQQAMHAVRTGKLPDGSRLPGWTPGWAHPSAWAPFVVVSDQDQ
jgi:CHAT domain-containing protein